jgi:hypothetical protein
MRWAVPRRRSDGRRPAGLAKNNRLANSMGLHEPARAEQCRTGVEDLQHDPEGQEVEQGAERLILVDLFIYQELRPMWTTDTPQPQRPGPSRPQVGKRSMNLRKFGVSLIRIR